MRRTPLSLVLLVIAALLGLVAPATAATAGGHTPAPATRPVDPIAHDPTMVKEKGWYYVAITGDAAFDDTYLPLKRSRDLVHWEELGPVLTELPAWVLESLGVTEAPRDAWAPDLSWSGTEWRLYYAVSQFGTNNSVIGLLTSPSLAHPQWEDQGLVVRSQPGVNTFNAIDPNLVTDADGGTWLSWGSFFSGIHVVPVDDATGKPVAGAQPVRIAQRQFAPNAEENPTIAFHDGYYYLFVSWDYCCRSVESDYRTIVGRSPSLTGPYVDADGVPLLDAKGGTEILRGYNEFVGAGGGDLLMDRNGRSGYFVNHYYDATDGGAPRLNVRKLTWGRDGWPVISDPINPSRSIGHGDPFVQIVPRDGTAVVENAGCGYEGANIALWTDLDNACQQWQLSDRGNGTRILNRFSNNVAEVGACANVDGGNVAQWGWLGFLPNNDCQRWSFAAAGDGWTTVASVLPGNRVWTVQGGPVPGSNLAISTPTGGADQQFRFEPVGEVLLANPTDSTTLTAPRGRAGAVTFRPRDERARQAWVVEPVAGTAGYTVRTADLGGCLDTDLRLVRTGCATWTLSPTDDGTWSLSSTGTTQAVRLLLP
ncbi:family 43 glycosylhydrolase [Cellulomonas humilata]|uniref:Family 43 glycosylhydrolase n=1 Tax=Cellulomonas humilata TaxID=144055 RepID=A0A7Y6DYY0_9CELL|nr:family 43 glycosylhydrolase [Cellulomonas humilata]NUU18532.1 family 43 glycosylhydrolase [Cellulomonas humilata]